MKHSVFVVLCMFMLMSCDSKKDKTDYSKYKVETLGEYVYVDKAYIVHTIMKCKAVYKKNSAQSVVPIIPQYLWYKESMPAICSQCFNSEQTEQLLSILSSDAYKTRIWLYEKMKEDFSGVPDWKTFNNDLDEWDSRKNMYELIKNKYDVGSFEEFDSLVTNYGDTKSGKRAFRKNNNLYNLYQTLLKNGYRPPEYEQFVKDMKSEENLLAVYNTLKKEGYTPPSFEEFKKDMGTE